MCHQCRGSWHFCLWVLVGGNFRKKSIKIRPRPFCRSTERHSTSSKRSKIRSSKAGRPRLPDRSGESSWVGNTISNLKFFWKSESLKKKFQTRTQWRCGRMGRTLTLRWVYCSYSTPKFDSEHFEPKIIQKCRKLGELQIFEKISKIKNSLKTSQLSQFLFELIVS